MAIVGTFAVMAAMGFSLNNLTLFGLVLAIGIVVDDAIVVVEAVEHHVERGMAPRAATARAMEEVSGPVIAIGLVLTAVFVPCAFITGIVGQFFRQFALTIATSTVISAFNSLTLSPALAAILIRPKSREKPEALPRLAYALAGAVAARYFYLAPLRAPRGWGRPPPGRPRCRHGGGRRRWRAGSSAGRSTGSWSGSSACSIAGFNAVTRGYTWIVGLLLKGSLAGPPDLRRPALPDLRTPSTRPPSGFIPDQDKGYLLVNVQMPDSTSLEHTQAGDEPGREGRAQDARREAHRGHRGAVDPAQRERPELRRDVRDARRLPPPDQGASSEPRPSPTGSRSNCSTRSSRGSSTSSGPRRSRAWAPRAGSRSSSRIAATPGWRPSRRSPSRPWAEGNNTDGLQGLFTSFRANTPWLFLNIDRDKVSAMGVSMEEVFNTLQVYLGSLYVNDFNRFGRTWQVNVQGDADFRKRIEDLSAPQDPQPDRAGWPPSARWPSIEDRSGPVLIMALQHVPRGGDQREPCAGDQLRPGHRADGRRRRRQLPQSMRTEWTELALLQLQTGNTAMIVFALAVVLVFLVLAAQYESWSLPLAVILVVPMCLLCSVIGVLMARMDINIFTQIGFIVLVGLACKNAILIVEFAKLRREQGVPRYQATLDACMLRLRPIMMTSFAFILGVVPLVLSEGAGAEMRRALGTAVFAGMLGVTAFGIFLTPVFYFVIQWVNDKVSGDQGRPTSPAVVGGHDDEPDDPSGDHPLPVGHEAESSYSR